MNLAFPVLKAIWLAEGSDSGIQPGTAFEDLPDDWVCPVCGAGKDDFEPED